MLFLLLTACDPTPDPDKSQPLCGFLASGDSCETVGDVEVWTIVPGTNACEECMGDTGGTGSGTWVDWRDTLVTTTTPDADGNFAADVDPGTYALYAEAGGCTACTVVEVTGDTCTDEAQMTLVMHDVADAPNVYLYPETTSPVLVRLGQPQALTLVDPVYPADGWRVIAEPDGRLRTAQGPRDYLYYEQRVEPGRMQTARGWCVAGAQAQASIEDAMADLGFNPQEIADFAEYWDVYFPRAEALTIYPQLDRLPALRVDPAPDSVLRAWFYVEDGCADVPMPELPAFTATGFVVTEWGVVLDRTLPREQPVVVTPDR